MADGRRLNIVPKKVSKKRYTSRAERAKAAARWTKKADAILREEWPDAPNREYLYNRLIYMKVPSGATRRAQKIAIAKRAAYLGLLVPFTEAEQKTIQRLHKRLKLKELPKKILARHTRNEVLAFIARKLPKKVASSRWTKEEDDLLRRMWSEMYGVRSLKRAFPGRTMLAIYRRAAETLKLKTGMPQGFLSVQELSEKFGYSWRITRRVLAEYNVPVHTINRWKANRLKITAVDPFAAMEAFKAWSKRKATMKTTHEAAYALGLDQTTIIRWLKAAGLAKRPAFTNRGYEIDPDAFAALTARRDEYLKAKCSVRV